MSPPLLRVENLRVGFPDGGAWIHPVRGVSFEIGAGEIIGLVGESGSGKTLTALSCSRLVGPPARVSADALRLGDVDLLRATDPMLRALRGRQIGMIPQDPLTSLHPSLTIGRQINDALTDHGVRGGERRRRALEVLDRVGLPDPPAILRRYPHELSGGMRQRATIGLALANAPSLLIADEPTTALDAMIQAQILHLLADLRASWQTSILLISHNLGVVAGVCDRLLVMYAGRIVESGPTSQVLAESMHPYTRALLEAVPRLESARALYGIPGTPPTPWNRPRGCAFHPRCAYRIERCQVDDPPAAVVGPGRLAACWVSQVRGGLPVISPTPSRGDGATLTVRSIGSTEDPLFQVTGVTRHFAVGPAWRHEIVHALDDISFDVHRGESLGIVGESGSGKTTLARLLALLDRPTHGEIAYDGEDLARLRGASLLKFRRRVQIVFQDPYSSLDPRYTVADAVREALRTHRICPPREEDAHIREVLDKVGLSAHFAGRYPHELSGGQRQRVCIARALAVRPEVLIADEPVSALDVSIQAQIVELFEQLRRQERLTLVVVAHDLALIRQVSDRVLTLYLGKIVEDAPAAVYAVRPRHPYAFALGRSVPSVERVGELPPILVTAELPPATAPPPGCRFHTRCFNAHPRCSRDEPPLVGDHGHRFACFYPVTEEQYSSLTPRTVDAGVR